MVEPTTIITIVQIVLPLVVSAIIGYYLAKRSQQYQPQPFMSPQQFGSIGEYMTYMVGAMMNMITFMMTPMMMIMMMKMFANMLK